MTGNTDLADRCVHPQADKAQGRPALKRLGHGVLLALAATLFMSQAPLAATAPAGKGSHGAGQKTATKTASSKTASAKTTLSKAQVVAATVKRGDSFDELMRRHGVADETSLAMAKAAKPIYNLARTLRPDDTLHLLFDAQGQVTALSFPLEQRALLVEKKDNASFTARFVSIDVADERMKMATADASPISPYARTTEVSSVPPLARLDKAAEVSSVPLLARATAVRYSPPPLLSRNAIKAAMDTVAEAPQAALVADKAVAFYPPLKPRQQAVAAMADPKSENERIEASLREGLSDAMQATRADLTGSELPKGTTRTVIEKVRKGDTLANVLGRQGLPENTAVAVSRASRSVFDLARKMKTGEEFRLAYNAENKLLGLSYPMDSDRVFWVVRGSNGAFVPKVEDKQFDVRARGVSGIINDSLYTAGRRVGLSQTMITDLTGLFEYDIDFARDIHPGDRFAVVYEQMLHKGKMVRTGEILAAEFRNQGERYQAFRYRDPSGRVGYFDANGESLRKMFIRAPVDFSRISSLFSNSRHHPVLGYDRAHKGVDYAAPMGTPVRTSGDGRVVFKGWQNGFGNLVLVRHNAKYTTAYAHLKDFMPGLHEGSQVSQGQVVGHVGMTGWATGPHLHYEVRVNNVQVNPLSVKLPSADPVPPRYLADFKRKIATQVAMLENREFTVADLGTRGGDFPDRVNP